VIPSVFDTYIPWAPAFKYERSSLSIPLIYMYINIRSRYEQVRDPIILRTCIPWAPAFMYEQGPHPLFRRFTCISTSIVVTNKFVIPSAHDTCGHSHLNTNKFLTLYSADFHVHLQFTCTSTLEVVTNKFVIPSAYDVNALGRSHLYINKVLLPPSSTPANFQFTHSLTRFRWHVRIYMVVFPANFVIRRAIRTYVFLRS